MPAKGGKGGNDGRADTLFSEVLPLFRMRVGVGCKRMTNLPPGWQPGTMQDVIAGITTGVSVNGEDRPRGPGEVGVLKISCVLRGRFDPAHYKTVISADRARVAAPVTGGTILVSRANTAELVGASAYVPQSFSDLFLPDKLWQLKPSKNVDVRWLSHVVADPAFRPKLASAATGTSASMKNISQEAFLALPVAIPLPERRRIAAILGTWDAAIEKAERVLTAKTYRRDHWHTALVLQFDGSTKPLRELITPVQRPVPRPSKPYTAIGIRSHGKGTFHRHVSRPEQIDMDTLFVVTARDLIVNITFAWEGAIALAKPRDEGCLVSHHFPTFDINENVVNRNYLGFAVNNTRFFYALRGISPGSAGRNRVLNQKDFLRLSIPFPPKKQQDRIAQLLTAADKDIAATADLIARLKTQKSGLMQKFLTGIIRVPEAAADLSPAAD